MKHRSKVGNARRLAIIAVALGALLAGCAASEEADAGPVELELWSWSGVSEPTVELWNETHPDIQVTLTQVPSGLSGGYTKMLTAIEAGNAPDLGQIEYPYLPAFAQSGGLVDLAEYGANELEDEFTSVMWGQVKFGDAVYAIPRDAGPLALFYRSDLFEEYGYTPPETWDEFAELSARVKAEHPEHFLSGVALDPMWWAALSQQAGAQWFNPTDEAWEVNIDDAPSQQVAKFWQNQLDSGNAELVAQGSPEWGAELGEGRYLTVTGAVWAQLQFNSVAPDMAGQWAVAPLPRWGEEDAGAQWGGSAFSVFEDSEHKEEAAEFVKWLGADLDAAEIVTLFGDYPATTTGQEIPATNREVEYFGGQNIYPIFKEAINNADERSATWGPTMTAVTTEFQDLMTRVQTGDLTMTEVFEQLQEATIEDMTQQGYSVEG